MGLLRAWLLCFLRLWKASTLRRRLLDS
ncbi:hypothetical protein V12B01_12905 [Vibrio splendidus 12B01]|nr:hypothetical protein V12B01_12905 [Vibrio splendidus 12B01]